MVLLRTHFEIRMENPMMRRFLPCFFLLLCCVCSCLAGLVDDPEIADGYLTTGEYVSRILAENNDKLTIIGGNATTLDAYDSSRIEIYFTSLPLSYTEKRGVYDIHLNDSSTLLFSGGATESLKVGRNASALLTGGTINVITIYRRPQDSCLVTIDCRDGWEWLYTAGKITGITGLWKNGDPFEIELYNLGSPWPPTAQYVNVIPEPATLLLLGFGGLLLRRWR
jgi:hypothetical protein